MPLTARRWEKPYITGMKTLALTYNYYLLPVLLRQLRQEGYCPLAVHDFIREARRELKARQAELLERRARFSVQLRLRTDLRFTDACFECEHRGLLYGLESLNSLEAFLDSGNLSYLNEILTEYGAFERQYEKLVRLRKRLPAPIQEDLQRAA